MPQLYLFICYHYMHSQDKTKETWEDAVLSVMSHIKILLTQTYVLSYTEKKTVIYKPFKKYNFCSLNILGTTYLNVFVYDRSIQPNK